MNKLANCLAPILVFVACSVDRPDAGDGDSSTSSVELAVTAPETAAPGASHDPAAGFGPCAPGSQGSCSGALFGTSWRHLVPLWLAVTERVRIASVAGLGRAV